MPNADKGNREWPPPAETEALPTNRLKANQAACLPAASSFTASVVSGLPPIPHSPLTTSEIFTQVTPRMFSPSIETIASVNFWMIWRFCSGLKIAAKPHFFFQLHQGGRLLLESRLPVRRPVLIRVPGGSTPASLRSGQSVNPPIAAQLFQA